MNTEIQGYEDSYSDFHKDAYGFRPRHMPNFTVEQWQAEFARLRAVCVENERERSECEAVAVQAFETLIAKLIRTGASDRASAIRWLHQAHNTDGNNDFLCFDLGLPYQYIKA